MSRRIPLALSTLLFGCPATSEPAPFEPPPLVELPTADGYPVVDGACVGPAAEPTHLIVTSTDFSTGAVGLVELATREVVPDLAHASTDAVAASWDDRAFVINRFGFDWIDELDPRDELALVHEFPIQPTSLDLSANPQALVFDESGRTWVSMFGAPELQLWNLPDSGRLEPLTGFDLSHFADVDGIPELSTLIACGEFVFAVAERIDRTTWTPTDATWLIPIASAIGGETLFDFNAAHPGADGIALLGTWFGAWRIDPSDPSGNTILVVNSGIERIDLAAGTSEWLIPDSTFAAAGFTHLHLAGFDLDSQGRGWIAAATPNFAEYRLYRLDPAGDPIMIESFAGLQGVSGDLEIVGDELWFADTTLGASGLRVFDVSGTDVVEFEFSPLPVGLPPLSLAPIRL